MIFDKNYHYSNSYLASWFPENRLQNASNAFGRRGKFWAFPPEAPGNPRTPLNIIPGPRS